MANMSYCRFENTYRDLQDCYNNINNQLSAREHACRERLVQLCEMMLEDYNPACQVDDEDEEEQEAQVTLRRTSNPLK